MIFIALLLSFAARAVSMTDGAVEMRVTAEPVRSRCVVTVSSGSHSLDEQACARALAAVPAQLGGLPQGSYLFPGRDRRYADGSCVLADGSPIPSDLASTCASILKRMGKARVVMAVNPEQWVRPADLPASASGPGSINLSVGVGPAGTASFCVSIRASGSAAVDKAACDAILKRAKFEPALDAAGQPVPSAYARQFRISAIRDSGRPTSR
jgi:hypothetical protein